MVRGSWAWAVALTAVMITACGDDDDGDLDAGPSSRGKDAAAGRGGGGQSDASSGTDGSSGQGGSSGAAGGSARPCVTSNMVARELNETLGLINRSVCMVCADDDFSGCSLAPYTARQISCIVDLVCTDADIENGANCMITALSGKHGECNQGGEASCGNDCYQEIVGDALAQCKDMAVQTAIASCNITF